MSSDQSHDDVLHYIDKGTMGAVQNSQLSSQPRYKPVETSRISFKELCRGLPDTATILHALDSHFSSVQSSSEFNHFLFLKALHQPALTLSSLPYCHPPYHAMEISVVPLWKRTSQALKYDTMVRRGRRSPRCWSSVACKCGAIPESLPCHVAK